MPVCHVSDLSDERLDVFARLTEAQLRNRLEPEKGVFIAESFKVIDRAVDAGYEMVSMLVTPKWLERADSCRLEILARTGVDIDVFVAPMEELEKLTGFKLTRGALAAMRRPELPAVGEVLAGARRVAVLDGIVDHTNVGAIFRSAAALDVDAVLVTPTCCDPLYRRAARVSMGTVFQVPWTRIGHSVERTGRARGSTLLHDLGFTVAAFALKDDSWSLADERLHGIERLAHGVRHRGGWSRARGDRGLRRTRCASPCRTASTPSTWPAASAVAFWELCEHRA